MAWKIGPALATGCTVILKPSEFTPLTALYMAKLVDEAGFPAGTFNLVNGYGATVGQAMADHHGIEKVRLNHPARIPALTNAMTSDRLHGQHARWPQDHGGRGEVQPEEGDT